MTVLDEIAQRYAHGDCVAFALATHRKFGWPVVELTANGVPMHAACRMPDGCLFDAYGRVSKDSVLARYDIPYSASGGMSYLLRDSCPDAIAAWGGLDDDEVAEPEIMEAWQSLEILISHMGRQMAEDNAFAEWFAGSQVIDQAGRPLVVYHGTFNVFTEFETSENTSEGAAFFSVDPIVASTFADVEQWGQSEEDTDANVMPVYLLIRNPMVIDASEIVDAFGDHSFDLMREAVDKAKNAGHDGLHILNVKDGGRIADQYAAFSPSQIKSAIGNSGRFDPSSPDITDGASIARRKSPKP